MDELWAKAEKFLSFETTYLHHRPEAAEHQVVAAYCGHLFERTDGLPQRKTANSVHHDMWMTRRGLEFLMGRNIGGTARFDDLMTALRRNFVPTIKANPLRFNQVRAISRDTMLDLELRALVVALWFSLQRPANELLVQLNDMIVQDGLITVFYLQQRKGGELTERLLPECQQWDLGELSGPFERWSALRRAAKAVRVFNANAVDRLNAYLRQLTPTEKHPLLRGHYTVYSVKRGAMQQLAWLDQSFERIQCLSLHRHLRAIAIYVGTFLNPKVAVSREMTKLLSRAPPAPVPPELLPHAAARRTPVPIPVEPLPSTMRIPNPPERRPEHESALRTPRGLLPPSREVGTTRSGRRRAIM